MSCTYNGSPLTHDLYYNTTVNKLLDLFEALDQRLVAYQEQHQNDTLAAYWDLLFDVIDWKNGSTSILGQLALIFSDAATLVQALTEILETDTQALLIQLLDSSPTAVDYACHQSYVDAHVANQDSMVFVGHSQGSLFLNVAYDYATSKTPAVQAVYVAPAAAPSTLRGGGVYVLDNNDIVIGALSLVVPTEPSNVDIPSFLAQGIGTDPSKNPIVPPDWSGHKFVDTYLNTTLATFPAVQSDVASALATVQPPPCAGPPAPPSTTGTATGDPHLLTFDRTRYDCQVWGETTLCLSPAGDLEVQMRTQQLGTENVATIRGVAARVGGDRVAIYLDGGTTENGIPVSFPSGKMTQLDGGGQVWNSSGGYVIRWPDNSQIRVTLGGFYMGVQMYIADTRKGGVTGGVTGLFGSAIGDAGYDLIPRGGGASLVSPASFEQFYGDGGYYSGYAGSWRIAPDASLFDYPDGESTQSPDITNLNFPTQIETADSLDGGVVAASGAICMAAGLSQDWMTSCELDVSLTDAQAAQAFADAPSVAATFDIQPPYAGPPQISSVYPQVVVAGGSLTLSGSNLATVSGDTANVTVTAVGAGEGGQVTVPLTVVSSGSSTQLTVSAPASLYQQITGPATVYVTTPDGVTSAASQISVVQADAFGDQSDAGSDGVFGVAYQLVSGTSRLPNFGSILSLTAPCSDPSVVSAADAGAPCPLTTFDMPNVNVSYTTSVTLPGYPSLTQYFALRFRGLLTVTTPGTYQFAIYSNDGSNVYLFDPSEIGGLSDGGTGLGTPVINNDGPNSGATPGTGSVTLDAKTYGIIVDYFQGQAPGLEVVLYWTPPGGTQAVVPASQLQAWVP
jgi:hypothetical protein